MHCWSWISCSPFTSISHSFVAQLKEFILNEPEAYEIKIGDQVFRRHGDPPLEAVIEKLQREKDKADDAPAAATKDDGHQKEEL